MLATEADKGYGYSWIKNKRISTKTNYIFALYQPAAECLIFYVK